MRLRELTHDIIPRRPAVCLVAIALVAALTLSIAGCGGDEGDSPQATVTAARPPTQAPTPQERRPWSFQGQRGITAAFAPADVELYRSLLPESFDMPDQPLVAVSVVDYYDVTLPLTHYHEGFVALQCKYHGRTGWHVVTMPVDDETSKTGGRAIGFPKYVADEIILGGARRRLGRPRRPRGADRDGGCLHGSGQLCAGDRGRKPCCLPTVAAGGRACGLRGEHRDFGRAAHDDHAGLGDRPRGRGRAVGRPVGSGAQRCLGILRRGDGRLVAGAEATRVIKTACTVPPDARRCALCMSEIQGS